MISVSTNSMQWRCIDARLQKEKEDIPPSSQIPKASDIVVLLPLFSRAAPFPFYGLTAWTLPTHRLDGRGGDTGLRRRNPSESMAREGGEELKPRSEKGDRGVSRDELGLKGNLSRPIAGGFRGEGSRGTKGAGSEVGGRSRRVCVVGLFGLWINHVIV